MNLQRQFFRYAIVGLSSNAILYLAYLALTASGIGHKTAMTLLYIAGALQTFLFNKRWTFSHDGAHRGPIIRYVLSYAFGYLLNLAMLQVLVDQFGFPHQIIQGLAIVVVSVSLFLLQRYWVFAHDSKAQAAHYPGRIQ